MAERLSRRLGINKTDTVRRALAAMERNLPDRPSTGALLERLDAWRATHPLPPETGPAADKAYFDRMWDEVD